MRTCLEFGCGASRLVGRVPRNGIPIAARYGAACAKPSGDRRASLDDSRQADRGVGGLRGPLVDLVSARLSGRVAGVPLAPGAPSLIAGTASGWSDACGRA